MLTQSQQPLRSGGFREVIESMKEMGWYSLEKRKKKS
jgi:hypothetical protein